MRSRRIAWSTRRSRLRSCLRRGKSAWLLARGPVFGRADDRDRKAAHDRIARVGHQMVSQTVLDLNRSHRAGRSGTFSQFCGVRNSVVQSRAAATAPRYPPRASCAPQSARARARDIALHRERERERDDVVIAVRGLRPATAERCASSQHPARRTEHPVRFNKGIAVDLALRHRVDRAGAEHPLRAAECGLFHLHLLGQVRQVVPLSHHNEGGALTAAALRRGWIYVRLKIQSAVEGLARDG
jgi:hypothetical protein